ncbi:hypothetical protein CSV74_11645 [Sporosarcina sp. P19]|nr:hypothetical protein CSV74_11645 [Sporosarcina sp. P19]
MFKSEKSNGKIQSSIPKQQLFIFDFGNNPYLPIGRYCFLNRHPIKGGSIFNILNLGKCYSNILIDLYTLSTRRMWSALLGWKWRDKKVSNAQSLSQFRVMGIFYT